MIISNLKHLKDKYFIKYLLNFIHRTMFSKNYIHLSVQKNVDAVIVTFDGVWRNADYLVWLG